MTRVTRLGDGRVRLLPTEPPGGEVDDLVAWLEARHDVIDVRTRDDAGSIEVRYDESAGVPGSFLRKGFATSPMSCRCPNGRKTVRPSTWRTR